MEHDGQIFPEERGFKMTKHFIGCDPGKNGGIGVITPSGSYAIKMPETEKDLLQELVTIANGAVGGTMAVLETVHSSPQMGVKSAFTFGQGYGGLRMALLAAGIPFENVTPQKWQKTLGCLTGGQKNVSKTRAQQLFPGIRITHNVADALLLSEYCRRTFGT